LRGQPWQKGGAAAAVNLNRLLLDLYRLVPGRPSPAFSDAVLERLAEEVAFDAALWGTFTGTAAGPRPHWGHLHRLRQEMLVEYEAVKHHDVLNAKLIARPGRTVGISLAQAARAGAHRSVIAHARKWGMEQTLATVVLESPLNLYTIVALYRANRRRPFSEGERRFKQALMPHLVAAWHMNAIQFLDAAADERPRSVRRARALIDPLGVIHNAEAGLVELLLEEWPDWAGPAVPPAALAGIQTAEGRYEGKAVVVALVRRLEDRTLVVGVRMRARADTLSERELAVARQFAAGKTYKEIADLFGTAPATVRSQIQTAYAKLGVSTKIDLGRQLDDSR
jgi:DNA-binding CsgD family transcriptional regulator